jgi:hypothetical protein
MSILDRKIMKENDLTPFGKIAILLAILLIFASVGTNIVQGNVAHPAAFWITSGGFLLFVIAKMSVILHKRWVSFGSSQMTENMANLYRLGYWLMAVGILLTFI